MVAEEVDEHREGALKGLALESRDVLDVRRDVVDEQPHTLALDAPRALVPAHDDVVRPEQVREFLGLKVAEVRVTATCRGHEHLGLLTDVALVALGEVKQS